MIYILSFEMLSSQVTQGDLTPIFPTFSNQILELNLLILTWRSTEVSNIQQNSVKLHNNLRF